MKITNTTQPNFSEANGIHLVLLQLVTASISNSRTDILLKFDRKYEEEPVMDKPDGVLVVDCDSGPFPLSTE